MYLFCAALVQEFRCFSQLCAADDGIVDEKHAAVLYQIADGNQLHFGNQVPLALYGRHEGTGPGRGVFNKGPGEGDAGGIGITDGMRGSGVRYARYDIR